MPYSKTPSVSTYDTKRIIPDFDFQSRDGSIGIDSYMENVMVDYLDEKNYANSRITVKPRPGLDSGIINTGTTFGTARGMYWWDKAGTIFYVIDNKLYSVTSGSTALTTLLTFSSTGDVGWCEFQYSTGVTALIMADGNDIYIITPALSVTRISTCPQPHTPNPIFLDGYIFLAKANRADIYNCVLDDPTTWNSGDFITAEMYPDNIVALSKNNNYLYAIGTQSIEYFYDAGNATGTPLARYAPAVQQFGAFFPNSVVQTEKEVIMLGTTQNGEYTAWVIDGFKATDISTPAVRQYISKNTTSQNLVRGMCIRVDGQKLYVVFFLEASLVYSFESKQWTLWTTGTGAYPSKAGFIGYWFAGLISNANGHVGYIMDAAGRIIAMKTTFLTDNVGGTNTPFECNIVTNSLDFGLINRKFMSRFSLVGQDSLFLGGTSGNTYNISWNDYDYSPTTWSTPQPLLLGNEFPCITQLGSFRRRAFKINCIPSYRFSIEGIEVDLNKGTQ